jgi:hypothetical protein
MRRFTLIAAATMSLAGCAASKQQSATELTAAYDVAAAAEAAYAARPGANPARVAQAARLLSAAQAALLTGSNSRSTADQTALNAAIAALVAYQAAVPVVSATAAAAGD